MNPRFDRHFENAKTWRAEKGRLRAILSDFPLSEELKWRKPCYCYEGSNVVIMLALKSECRLGFFKGALIEDDSGLLTAPGENSQASRQLCFTSIDEIDAQEDAIRAIIAAAIEVEKKGLKVDFKAKHELEPIAELTAKMDADPAFAEAFAALTPGRQRGWSLHFSGAKKSETRTARIEKAAPAILAGKGLHER